MSGRGGAPGWKAQRCTGLQSPALLIDTYEGLARVLVAVGWPSPSVVEDLEEHLGVTREERQCRSPWLKRRHAAGCGWQANEMHPLALLAA